MVKINLDPKKLGFDKIPWNKINLTKIPSRIINKIPLDKIPLNTMPLKRIGGLLNKVIPKKDVKKGEKLISYIRIYTHLVNAYDLMNVHMYDRAFDHLVIVKNLTRGSSFQGEKSYLGHIRKIAVGIIKKRRPIVRRLHKYAASDPAHSKTNLLLAQNICVIRMIKINL